MDKLLLPTRKTYLKVRRIHLILIMIYIYKYYILYIYHTDDDISSLKLLYATEYTMHIVVWFSFCVLFCFQKNK